MTAVPPGGTAFVPFDTLPLLYLQQDGAAAHQTGVAPPGSTATVHADVVPPLSFAFGAVRPSVARPAAHVPLARPPRGGTLAATGWSPPGVSLLVLGLSWVLARRLRAEDPSG